MDDVAVETGNGSSSPAGSGEDWSTEVRIQTAIVQIRPIRAQDAELYQAFADRITLDNRRLRFFYAGPELTPTVLSKLTQIDESRETAFVAVDNKLRALLGVSRMVFEADTGSAEFAIIVSSDLQGRGLGGTLMRQLIKYAHSRNIALLHGAVLGENTRMLQMCRKWVFESARART